MSRARLRQALSALEEAILSADQVDSEVLLRAATDEELDRMDALLVAGDEEEVGRLLDLIAGRVGTVRDPGAGV